MIGSAATDEFEDDIITSYGIGLPIVIDHNQ